MPRRDYDDEPRRAKRASGADDRSADRVVMFAVLFVAAIVICAIFAVAVVISQTQQIEQRTVQTVNSADSANSADSVTIGGAEVSIAKVTIGPVPLKSFDGESASKQDNLAILVRIATNDPTRKFNYRTWQNTIQSFARLRDNFGNRYRGLDFGLGTEPIGHIRTGAITTSERVEDVLVFEPPIPTAEYLDLDLPGENLGVNGTFQFRIPKSAWQAPKAAPQPQNTTTSRAEPPVQTTKEPPAPSTENAKPEPPEPEKPKPRRQPEPEDEPKTSLPRTNDDLPTAMVMPPDGKRLTLALNAKVLADYQTAFALHPDQAKQMLKDKEVMIVDKPVKVRVEGEIEGNTYVRVLVGPNAGKLYIVPSKYMK